MEVRCLNDEGTVESWLPARVLESADNRGNYCIRLLGEDDTENRNDGDARASGYNMDASELRPLFDPTESSGAACYVSSGNAAVEGLRVDCCMYDASPTRNTRYSTATPHSSPSLHLSLVFLVRVRARSRMVACHRGW